jgi:hypothetical protein
VGGGVGAVGAVEDWRVGLRLRFGVERVVLELEFELWVLVLVLLSLESAWGCGLDFGFDLVRELGLDLDLKTPILLALEFGIAFSAVFGVLDVGFGLVWFGFGFWLGWVEYRLDVM